MLWKCWFVGCFFLWLVAYPKVHHGLPQSSSGSLWKLKELGQGSGRGSFQLGGELSTIGSQSQLSHQVGRGLHQAAAAKRSLLPRSLDHWNKNSIVGVTCDFMYTWDQSLKRFIFKVLDYLGLILMEGSKPTWSSSSSWARCTSTRCTSARCISTSGWVWERTSWPCSWTSTRSTSTPSRWTSAPPAEALPHQPAPVPDLPAPPLPPPPTPPPAQPLPHVLPVPPPLVAPGFPKFIWPPPQPAMYPIPQLPQFPMMIPPQPYGPPVSQVPQPQVPQQPVDLPPQDPRLTVQPVTPPWKKQKKPHKEKDKKGNKDKNKEVVAVKEDTWLQRFFVFEFWFCTSFNWNSTSKAFIYKNTNKTMIFFTSFNWNSISKAIIYKNKNKAVVWPLKYLYLITFLDFRSHQMKSLEWTFQFRPSRTLRARESVQHLWALDLLQVLQRFQPLRKNLHSQLELQMLQVRMSRQARWGRERQSL